MKDKTEKRLIEKWGEIVESANVGDPKHSFNLFKGLIEQTKKEILEKIEELKDEIILNDIYTADEIVRIINKKKEEIKK